MTNFVDQYWRFLESLFTSVADQTTCPDQTRRFIASCLTDAGHIVVRGEKGGQITSIEVDGRIVYTTNK